MKNGTRVRTPHGQVGKVRKARGRPNATFVMVRTEAGGMLGPYHVSRLEVLQAAG